MSLRRWISKVQFVRFLFGWTHRFTELLRNCSGCNYYCMTIFQVTWPAYHDWKADRQVDKQTNGFCAYQVAPRSLFCGISASSNEWSVKNPERYLEGLPSVRTDRKSGSFGYVAMLLRNFSVCSYLCPLLLFQ